MPVHPDAMLLAQAERFASLRHDGHVRKYTGARYFDHLQAVVDILRGAGVTDTPILAAAYLHDVVEDSKATFHEVRERFGDDVTRLVYWLTDLATAKDGKRATRVMLSCERLAWAPKPAKLIKLADLIDNTADIAAHDKRFAMVYIPEKQQTLVAMNRGNCLGNHPLYQRAVGQINDLHKSLGIIPQPLRKNDL